MLERVKNNYTASQLVNFIILIWLSRPALRLYTKVVLSLRAYQVLSQTAYSASLTRGIAEFLLAAATYPNSIVSKTQWHV